ncbi:glycosyltransferase family 2 protein [Leuconostoc gelidum subsp. gasicomitatum]|uniref:glycosyltransferase family 2 protein n=1 Tax=Leuconostoc gasicomitatum TaxID=115778 RepID=UPI001CC445D2|nr:glycosyltransferase family 2 protein [Leuconostoc gasicomitatum]MBZ5957453.1 glycosyltransferase family 2 protein [Leuconostoc gasicomitatum]
MVKNITWSIVVTFNPVILDLERLISQLILQQSNVVLVNNGIHNSKLESLISDKIFVIQLSTNQGIAKAQNEGIIFAKKYGATGVFLFDQDSRIPDEYIKTMIDTEISEQVGMLVPRVLDLNTKCYLEPRTYQRQNNMIHVDFPRNQITVEKLRRAAKPIASGSYILMEALESVGGMREDFFIDAVDTDFSFRLIERGYEIVQLNNVILEHKVGNKTRKKIVGKIFFLSNHSASRRYYIGRNNIWLLKIHRKKIKGINKDVFITLGSQLLYSIFEKHSFGKIIHFFYGIISGMVLSPNTSIREIN